jgi:hypothetical protein
VNIVSPSLRLTRAGIVLLLAVLVAFLGAAAKRSQFDESSHHGYLAKAVKMAGARMDPNTRLDSLRSLASQAFALSQDNNEMSNFSSPVFVRFVPVSLLSRPLRV